MAPWGRQEIKTYDKTGQVIGGNSPRDTKEQAALKIRGNDLFFPSFVLCQALVRR